jgi:hypothetical protein
LACQDSLKSRSVCLILSHVRLLKAINRTEISRCQVIELESDISEKIEIWARPLKNIWSKIARRKGISNQVRFCWRAPSLGRGCMRSSWMAPTSMHRVTEICVQFPFLSERDISHQSDLNCVVTENSWSHTKNSKLKTQAQWNQAIDEEHDRSAKLQHWEPFYPKKMLRMLRTYDKNECIVAHVQLVPFSLPIFSVKALLSVLDYYLVAEIVEFHQHITTCCLDFIYHILQLLNKTRKKGSHYPMKSLSDSSQWP